MPSCQFLFIASVLIKMLFFIGTAIIIWKLTGHRASRVALVLSVTCLISLPFLFYYRSAVYHGIPSYGDTSLGWPLIYAHAQSDAGLAWRSRLAFLVDFAIGIIVGVVLLQLCHYHKKREKPTPHQPMQTL